MISRLGWLPFVERRISQRVITLTAKFTVIAPGWNKYKGQMSKVLPARSTRQHAFATMLLDFIQRSKCSGYTQRICTLGSSPTQGLNYVLRSLCEELAYMAELTVTLREKIRCRLGLKRRQVLRDCQVHEYGSGIVIIVRSALRFGDYVINNI